VSNLANRAFSTSYYYHGYAEDDDYDNVTDPIQVTHYRSIPPILEAIRKLPRQNGAQDDALKPPLPLVQQAQPLMTIVNLLLEAKADLRVLGPWVTAFFERSL
jgi:hypothetical protein